MNATERDLGWRRVEREGDMRNGKRSDRIL